MTKPIPRSSNRLAWLTATLAASALLNAAQAEIPESCGPVKDGYGPWDYRRDRGSPLAMVEEYHFTPAVEALTGGRSGPVAGDLDYTLRAFPNHHRALNSMMRLAARLKVDQVDKARYTVECYFLRATRQTPDDAIVRMLFAQFLGSKLRVDEAVQQLEYAGKQAGDNGLTQYNIGLVYFDLKQYDRALAQAHLAMSLGMARTELKSQLVSVGKWIEPATDRATPATPAASAP